MENNKNHGISCEIITDLLASYVDDICSVQSKILIENHIKTCKKCSETLRKMKSDAFIVSNVPENNVDLLEITNSYKEKQKRQKNTNRGLVAISASLALCLIISLIPKPTFLSNSTNHDKETDILYDGTVGISSQKSFGKYNSASDYTDVYDYAKSISDNAYDRFFGIKGLREELMVVEDIQQEEAADDAHSSTNIMTAGVDESDISKTDGKYIYNVTSSEVIIFDIESGVAEEICRLEPKFESPSDIVKEMYVDNDRLNLVTEHDYKYNREYRTETIVLNYDITDRKAPKFLSDFKQDGYYNTSRKSGDIIYLFTENHIASPNLSKKKAIEETNIAEWFPTVNERVMDPGCIYIPDTGRNVMVISSFNQNAPKTPIDAKAIINEYASTYVGESSIYLYSRDYSSNRSITEIAKIKYDMGHLSMGNTTTIRGEIRDTFAINEQKGYLRVVATETGDVISNALYVFDSDLKLCGKVNNIANGEQLYACRFVGDMGYFVTFLNTDPLFAVDLSDPHNPTLIGELKVYGFSEYLHIWDESHVLGIGYDADSDGDTKGLKLSMFDVSDSEQMVEEAKYVINNAYTACGFRNYKAILADPSENIIGFAYEAEDGEYYELLKYTNGKFERFALEKLESIESERVRGHFNKVGYYISMDTKVTSVFK